MSKFKMTREQRVQFFYEISRRLGPWDRTTWGVKYVPSNYSSNMEMFPVMDDIITSMIKGGLFSDEIRPRDGEALFNKLIECLNTDPEMDASQIKNSHSSRMAAYEGGFIAMDDLLHIDKIHQVKIQMHNEQMKAREIKNSKLRREKKGI